MKKNFLFLTIAAAFIIYQQGLKDGIITIFSALLAIMATALLGLLLWRLITGKWDILQRIQQSQYIAKRSPEETKENEEKVEVFTLKIVGTFLIITCVLVTIVALFLKMLTFYKTGI